MPMSPSSSLISLKCLGLLSDTNFYHNNFQYITQSLNLNQVYVILTSFLSPKERECVQMAAPQAHDNALCVQDRSQFSRCCASSKHQSLLNYQPNSDELHNQGFITTCLLARRWQHLRWSILTKMKEITWRVYENPALFFSHLLSARGLGETNKLDLSMGRKKRLLAIKLSRLISQGTERRGNGKEASQFYRTVSRVWSLS